MKLFDYQIEGRDYLAERERAYLADAPGMGKTVQTITALLQIKARRPLIVCPASVVGAWRAEWLRWGDPKKKLSVVSYSRLVGNLQYRRAVSQLRPDVLVLDEAHYVINPSAQRTQFTIGDGRNRPLIQMIDSVKRVWLLSGTPYPNTQFDLHATLKRLWPDVLKQHRVGHKTAWLNLFHWEPGYQPPGWSKPKPRILGVKDPVRLQSILSAVMLERTFESVGYEITDLIVRLQPILPNNNELVGAATLEDLQSLSEEQISTERRVLGEVKAILAGDLIKQELEDDHYPKIVVFSYHRAALDTLESKLGKFGLLRLDGSTSESERTTRIAAFQTKSNIRVFLAQMTAGGVGVTLTAAHHVAIIEPSWVPAENEQAIKRCHRIGQTQIVQARLFVVPGTLDDQIQSVNTRKLTVQGATK